MNLFNDGYDIAFREKYQLALKKLFRGQIKTNFMMKILHKVVDEMGAEMHRYYPQDFSLENFINRETDPLFDICKIIVGIHKSNMVFVCEQKQKDSLNSLNYERQIVSKVIEHIKLRSYGSAYFRQHQIVAGDRFLFFPLPYDLFVLCMRINRLLRENGNSEIPYRKILAKLSNKGLAALSLLEDNFLDNAYPVCRGMIELYISYLVLKTNKKATKKFELFSNIKVRHTQCGEPLSQDFLTMFNERRKKEKENEPYHQFLHFGWVDEIVDYHKIVAKNPYTIKGLIKYLKEKEKCDGFEIYEVLYQKCNSYVHANIINTTYPLLSYFEICIMLFNTLFFAYQDLCQNMKCDTKIDDIDILQKTKEDYDRLVKQYNNRTTRNFEQYYKQ